MGGWRGGWVTHPARQSQDDHRPGSLLDFKSRPKQPQDACNYLRLNEESVEEGRDDIQTHLWKKKSDLSVVSPA